MSVLMNSNPCDILQILPMSLKAFGILLKWEINKKTLQHFTNNAYKLETLLHFTNNGNDTISLQYFAIVPDDSNSCDISQIIPMSLKAFGISQKWEWN